MHEEIARIAYVLYEKSWYINGRDFENWLDAERIVLTRHASQDIEEPEGEETIIVEEGLIEEVEGTTPLHAGREKEEYTTLKDILMTGGNELRCWSAGCCSGEEPYTLQILWKLRVDPVLTEARTLKGLI